MIYLVKMNFDVNVCICEDKGFWMYMNYNGNCNILYYNNYY